MTHFLIVHGAYGSPQENWFPWMKTELEKLGHTADVPSFPTPDGHSWDNWYPMALAALDGHAHANTVLIGHSIGAAFVLRMAQHTQEPFKMVYAVCPFVRDLGIPQFDVLNPTFFNPPLQWDKVKQGAKEIICMAGDNDPYVPLALAEEVASNCGVKLNIVPGGGHLNAMAGYTRFPLLLNKLRLLT